MLRPATDLLFDLDGTLTDPYEGITRCVAYALEAFDIPVADRRELSRYIGPPLKQGFMDFHGLSAGDAEQAVARYRERFADIGLYENRVYPGIADLLAERYAAGQRLYVATSKPHYFARTIIDHFELGGYFTAVHGSELDGRRTDKRDLLAHIVATEGLAPDDTLMIGDRRYDLDGAAANGIAAIAVGYGYGSRSELAAAGAGAIHDSPAALARALRENHARATPEAGSIR